MATRGSQEPLTNMEIYNKLKKTIEQLHSANAQITTLQQHNQKMTKDNETLQQKNVELTKKIKDYEEQVKKQSETIKVMTEEKKKTIEEYNKVNDLLASSKHEVVKLNDKISLLMDTKGRVLRTNDEEKYYRFFLRLREIVYDEKIDDWVASQWRLMERTDFEAFVGDLRAIFEEEAKLS